MAESKGGGQPGNSNATKGKPWAAAIERALKSRSLIDQRDALDALAEKLLSACDDKDMTALKELGDRLDGKPKQTLSGDPDSPLYFQRIEQVIIDPGPTNRGSEGS